VSDIDGLWKVQEENNVPMVANVKTMRITFSAPVHLDSVLIHDNDPKEEKIGWSINQQLLPTTPDNTWAPWYSLNVIADEIRFEYVGIVLISMYVWSLLSLLKVLIHFLSHNATY